MSPVGLAPQTLSGYDAHVTGFFPDFSQRCEEPEIMDGKDYTAGEARQAYADLRRVNKYLGGSAALLRHLRPLMAECDSRPVTILDVGTGSADIPRAIVRLSRRLGIEVQIVGLELSSHALAAAGETLRLYPQVALVKGEALQLPFLDYSFDFVIASELLHHLSGEQGAAFLCQLNHIARIAFLINDLRRHPIPYYSFWLLSRLLTSNRLIRNDGLISIRRGFTLEDFRVLQRSSGLPHLSVYFHFPYRIVIEGRKRSRSGPSKVDSGTRKET